MYQTQQEYEAYSGSFPALTKQEEREKESNTVNSQTPQGELLSVGDDGSMGNSLLPSGFW